MMGRLLASFFKPVDIYLYVPFMKEEMSDEYGEQVRLFAEACASKHKNKAVDILFYGEKALAKLPINSKIYVLGHGIDVSGNEKWASAMSKSDLPFSQLRGLRFSEWALSVTAGIKAISIDTVAKRMLEDGILSADQLTIKLWFCDAGKNAFAIAEQFFRHFMHSSHSYRIDYYFNQFLYSPSIKDGVMRKWASDADSKAVVRASRTRESLYSIKPVNDASIVKLARVQSII